MINRTACVCLTALAMLAACSKTAPQQEPAAAKADAPAQTAAPVVEQGAPVDRARVAAGMLALIGTQPECQAFRTEIEEAGKAMSGPADATDLSQIVAKAHQAGCTTAPKNP